jgi:hypothetical protein
MTRSCIVCLKKDGLKSCGKCKAVFYCSVDCQKNDWPDHKIVCIPIERDATTGLPVKTPKMKDGFRFIEDNLAEITSFYLQTVQREKYPIVVKVTTNDGTTVDSLYYAALSKYENKLEAFAACKKGYIPILHPRKNDRDVFGIYVIPDLFTNLSEIALDGIDFGVVTKKEVMEYKKKAMQTMKDNKKDLNPITQ